MFRYLLSSRKGPDADAGKVKYIIDKKRVKEPCLSEKCDWFLSHCLGVTNIGPDDFSERLLGSLKDGNTRL